MQNTNTAANDALMDWVHVAEALPVWLTGDGVHGGLGFGGGKLGPNFQPVLAQLLASDGAPRFDLHLDAGFDGKRLVSVSYVFKVAGGGFATLGERFALGGWQGEKVFFEWHNREITPDSVRPQAPFGVTRLFYFAK